MKAHKHRVWTTSDLGGSVSAETFRLKLGQGHVGTFTKLNAGCSPPVTLCLVALRFSKARNKTNKD